MKPPGRRKTRKITVPLDRVMRGQPRSLRTARDAWLTSLAAVTAELPKLTVRVRFPSGASVQLM
jgi:hypothetical protein